MQVGFDLNDLLSFKYRRINRMDICVFYIYTIILRDKKEFLLGGKVPLAFNILSQVSVEVYLYSLRFH